MGRVFEFVFQWIVGARVQWLRGDPMLMGAAIAYNSLFALVPLGFAFVSIMTLLNFSSDTTSGIVDFINSALPQGIADLLDGILDGSSTAIEGDQTLVLIISILIALWSGSRAVYAVQKSLRLVQAVPDERGYLRTRFIGIAVTVGAGVSVLVGYALLLFGEVVWHEVAARLGFGTAGAAQLLISALMIAWVFGLLWVVYRFGPPNPVRHTTIVTALVEIVLVAGSWVALNLLPTESSSAVAAFGSLGVLLVLLYFVGVVVVSGPILVTSGWEAWSEAADRYAHDDERDQIETEGPQERSGASGEAPQ